jgi:2-keto-4-pentenoate hydratase
MAVIDPRLVAALREQLAARRRTLDAGASHVGWKLGMGARESIGGHIAVGYITSSTVLDLGGAYTAARGEQLHADAEALLELAGPYEIAAYGLALEIVDLHPRPGEPASIVASNVFHRAVAFGTRAREDRAGMTVSLRVNGEERDRGPWPEDLRERIAKAAEILDAAGEHFGAGDLIITGSVVQIPIVAGDHVETAVGKYAPVSVDIV